jgi:multiple sugar transport system substrate-binding protein
LSGAGCGGGGNNQGGGKVVLNVWKTFEDSEHMDRLFEEYRAKHPNVEIVYTKKNVENYEQDLLNALASGTGPDIFSIHNSWLPKYLDKTAPAPDQSFTYKDYKDAFVDTVVKDFTKDQKIYGVALSVDSLALYYNKDLLGSEGIATPPKTWTELVNQAKKLKRSDGKGYFTRSGVALGTNKNINRAVDILYLMMLQKGAVPFAEDLSNPTFAQNVQKGGNYIYPAREALEFYTSFADPFNPNYNWNMRSDYSIDAFANGRTALLYSYAYSRDTILLKNPNLNFDVAPVPQPNLEDPAVNFSNYWGEVVSKQSKNQAWAWDLLKSVSSKENLDKYYAGRKQPSSRKDLIELQIQDPEIGVFAFANLTAKPFYRPDQVKMDELFGKMIDNVILNGFEPDEALNQAEQQADTLVRGYE